jgi:hypothetical protein
METTTLTIGPATQKLISELLKHSTIETGSICKNKDGELYRHDHVVLKYPNAAYWLILLFNKAAEENGEKHGRHFFAGNYSVHFDRSKFKCQKDGKISYSELIIL